jgi:hypothetical protein
MMKLQIPLSAANYPIWSVTLYLQPGTTFEYKFVRKETDGRVRGVFYLNLIYLNLTQVVWESDPTRQLTVANTPQTVTTSWR